MKEKTKRIMVLIGATVLALAVIATASFGSKNMALRATDDIGEAPAEAPAPAPAPVVEPKVEPPASAPAPVKEEPVVEKKEVPVETIPEPKEEPKKEEPKAEEPKAEEPKAEEPKAEEPKAEEPKVEEPKAEETIEEKKDEEIKHEEIKEPFNVKKAYAYYLTLNEKERSNYLNSLSAEDRNALVKYIEKMEKEAEIAAAADEADKDENNVEEIVPEVETSESEDVIGNEENISDEVDVVDNTIEEILSETEPTEETDVLESEENIEETEETEEPANIEEENESEEIAEDEGSASEEYIEENVSEESALEDTPDENLFEETEKKVDIWFTADQGRFLGSPIVFHSSISGYENPVYQWQYSLNGTDWKDIPGANGPTYSFHLDIDNSAYYWNLSVNEAEPPVAEGE